MYIKDIMTTDIISVKEDDTVEKSAKLLAKNHFSGLPVVDNDGYLKGIITEGDLIKHNSTVQVLAFLEILGGIIYLDDPNKYFDNVKKSMGHFVKTVMTEEVVSVNSDGEIKVGARLLVSNQVNRLPVIDERGKLVGIVSRKDIMNHLFQNE